MSHSHRSRFWFVLLLLAATPTLAAQKAREKRVIQLEDYFALARVRDPRVSPDGAWVAYTVTRSDLKKDKSETSIWMVPAAGGEPLRMTAAGTSASRPRWSPDGRYLAFQAARGQDAKTQVWILDRRGGEAQQLTRVPQGISSYEWSPEAGRLVLTIRDPRPGEKGKKGKKEKPRPWVIDRLQFKRDYVGYLDRRRTHLYVFDLKTRGLRQITSGDYDDSQPAWSPDGRLIAFVSNRTEEPDSNDNSDIWIVSAANTDKGATLRRLTRNPGSDTAPAWSPDGSAIAYLTVTQPDLIWYAIQSLALVPSKGGPTTILTPKLDRNVYSPRFDASGRGIYFLLEESGQQQLAWISREGTDLERKIAGPRVVLSFDPAGEDRVALLLSRPDLPAEVFLAEGKKLRQLSETNRDLLSRLKLAQVEKIHFPSRDGTSIEGFLVKPPDFNSKLRYPTLLRIHGGPVSQYDFRFHFEAQLFAAHGYVVLLPNPRGSSGYGQAFSMGIYQSWGQKDFEDVMAAVDYAIQQGYADPKRLGVGGWSYGGILTNYVITQTDRFQAAITGASEVLYVANYGHDHYQYEWEKELGLPWENRALWEKLSPFNSVQKIVTPTLIMGGEKDWNVPVLNSEQLYQALRRLGRTTQLVVYPGEHHGFRRPTFQRDRWLRYLAWYDRYVKGEKKAQSP